MSANDWKEQLLKDPYNLQNIARSFRMRNSEFRHTRFDYFSAHPKMLEVIRNDEVKIAPQFEGSHPLIVSVAETAGLKIQKFLAMKYYDQESTLNVFMQGAEFNVPKCFSLILISPELGTGDRSVDRTASNLINLTISLLFGLLGRENITDHIGTLFVDSDNGAVSYQSPDFSNVTLFEKFEVGDYSEYREISERFNKQLSDTKNRLRLAFNLFSRAIFEQDRQIRFIYYWISLEVLSNSQNQGVIDRLANAYGVSKSQIILATQVEDLHSKRNNLFHHGIFDGLHPRLERAIACIFLDLLRHEIGLPNKKHAELFSGWQKTIA
jgi:hypothetical protein